MVQIDEVSATPRRGWSPSWYLVAVAIALLACLMALGLMDWRDRMPTNGLWRGEVPGTIEIEAEALEAFTLLNEIASSDESGWVEGGFRVGLLALVRAPDGQPAPLSALPDQRDYDVGGSHYVEIAQFIAEEAGTYQVEGYFADGTEAERAVFVIVPDGLMPLLRSGFLPTALRMAWPAAALVLLAIPAAALLAGIVCRSRIGRLVDYESRAVPTMTSTTMPAALWRRATASILDSLAVVFTVMLISPALLPLAEMIGLEPSLGPSLWTGLGLAAGFLALFFTYFVVFEALLGWTPGKFIMSVRVVTAEGRRLGFERSLVRNALRSVDFLPFAYIVGAIAHILSRNNKRIGDRLADTRVVIR